MTDVIPASKEALDTWLVDSLGNVAVSGAGIALLEAEIRHLHRQTSADLNLPNEPGTEA